MAFSFTSLEQFLQYMVLRFGLFRGGCAVGGGADAGIEEDTVMSAAPEGVTAMVPSGGAAYSVGRTEESLGAVRGGILGLSRNSSEAVADTVDSTCGTPSPVRSATESLYKDGLVEAAGVRGIGMACGRSAFNATGGGT